MDARQWLEQVRGELSRRKLPPFYAQRLVDELSDHLNDFLEDRMSTDAKDLHDVLNRLGAPSQVAATAASEFRKQRFSRRHPVLTFVVMPVATLALLWASAIFLLVTAAGAVSWLSTGSDERIPEWLIACMPVVACGLVLAPIALTSALFCRVAKRSTIGWKWPLGACLVLAIIGGMAMFDIKMSNTTRSVLYGVKVSRENNHLMFGFGLNTHARPWQIVQFALPLAICACFISRQASQRRQHVLAG